MTDPVETKVEADVAKVETAAKAELARLHALWTTYDLAAVGVFALIVGFALGHHFHG